MSGFIWGGFCETTIVRKWRPGDDFWKPDEQREIAELGNVPAKIVAASQPRLDDEGRFVIAYKVEFSGP